MNWALAVVSAILLVLCHPPYDFTWLAPVALAPLLIAVTRTANWKQSLLLGCICGALYWAGICYWIEWTLSQYAGVPKAGAVVLFVMFCLAKSLQMGVFALVARQFAKTFWTLPLTAAAWTAIEWTHGVMGFEWLNLGNAGSEMSLPLRLAPVTGVWGLSFFFALAGAALAAVALRRPRKELVWVILLPGLAFLPKIQLDLRAKAEAVLLQPNQDAGTVWTAELFDKSLRRMIALSLKAAEQPDLIIWPEDPGPFYEYDPRYMGALGSLAGASGATVIAGAVGHAPHGGPSNSAVTVNPLGKELSRYDKVNLVPFGEFVPFPFQQLTNQISTEAGEFEPGHNIVITDTGKHKTGTFICYESVFPSFVRQFAKSGAEVLVNISNDGWFGKSAARYQHLRIVRMRAVENSRWILRATNNGVTAVIDPAGRVITKGPEYVEAALNTRFAYLTATTFYTEHGDWFVLLCGLAMVCGLVRHYFQSAP